MSWIESRHHLVQSAEFWTWRVFYDEESPERAARIDPASQGWKFQMISQGHITALISVQWIFSGSENYYSLNSL